MQNIENSRTQKMRERMAVLHERGQCFFCKEGQELFEKVNLFKTDLWYVTINDAPYPGAEKHVMAVPVRHLTTPEDLTHDERNDFFDTVIPWLRKEYGMDGLSCLFRFGNTKRTGATLHHLHFHCIEGAERKDQNHEPVFAVVGFKSDNPQKSA